MNIDQSIKNILIHKDQRQTLILGLQRFLNNQTTSLHQKWKDLLDSVNQSLEYKFHLEIMAEKIKTIQQNHLIQCYFQNQSSAYREIFFQ